MILGLYLGYIGVRFRLHLGFSLGYIGVICGPRLCVLGKKLLAGVPAQVFLFFFTKLNLGWGGSPCDVWALNYKPATAKVCQTLRD